VLWDSIGASREAQIPLGFGLLEAPARPGLSFADAKGEMRARYRHRSRSSRLQVVAAQAVVVLAA